jgi:hypothetical protein
MTSAGTTAFAAKRQLVTYLSQAVQDITISYSNPLKYTSRQGVYLGSIRGNTQIAAMRAGTKSRNEIYTLDIHCWAVGGPDAQGADTLLESTQQAIEAGLAQDTTIGFSVGNIQWAVQSDWEIQEPVPFDQPGLYFSESKISIEVHARNF